jgi:aspartyl-tRNA(Asn)/glutamyl-tRNA(Gln) amidotransferase subunit C
MSLDKATVQRIAYLARVKVPDEDLDHLAGELSQIIDWVEQLSEVNTDGVEAMASVSNTTLPLRADEVTGGGISEKATANAPESEHGFFLVPKVVE